MGNPAEDLEHLFKKWRDNKGTSDAVRSVKTQSGVNDHLEAMRCLVRITDAIDELEQAGRRVDRYRGIYPKWVHGVLSYPQGWQQANVAQSLFNNHMMSLLEGLAEDIKWLRPPPSSEEIRHATAIFDEVKELATSDLDLPAHLREYVHRINQHARNCVEDYEKLGKFDLQDAVERLLIAVQAAEGASTGDKKSRWHKIVEKIIKPVYPALLANAPATAIAAAQLAQSGGA